MKATMTKQQAVENVTNSISSIFSKEDVIKLINSIEDTQSKDIFNILQDLRSKVCNKISNASSEDIVDFDSAELEMDYNRTVNLQSIDIRMDDLECDIDELFQDVISEIMPENSENTENNEQQN